MKFYNTVIYLVVLVFSYSCYSQKQILSPLNFGCVENTKFNNNDCLQSFFDTEDLIIIPKGTYTVLGDLNLQGNKTLIINGTLKGIKGNERIFCTGNIKIKGNGSLEGMSLEILGGDSISISDVKFYKSGRSAAILINNDNFVIKSFILDNVEIEKGPYGLMRQGAYGERSINKAIIKNCYVHDGRGDGITWNNGLKDGQVLIVNNRVENLDSDFGGKVGKSWGMGIAVAGSTFKDDFSNCVADFIIEGNNIKNVRHGIHVEAGKNFIIRNNIVEVSNVSKKSKLSLAGIIITGSSDYQIIGNDITAVKGKAVVNAFGSLPKVGFLCPPTNYVIEGNVIRGKMLNWCNGDDNSVTIRNNQIWGVLDQRGRAKINIINNQFYNSSNPVIISFETIKGRRGNYDASSENISLNISNNNLNDSIYSSAVILNESILIRNN